MKFEATVLAALISAANAQGGAAAVVNSVLTDIGSAISAFDTTIKGFSGDATSLIAAAGKIQQTTTAGAGKISSGAPLTLNDAVSITTTVQGLQGTLDTTLADLESAGPALAKAGQCEQIQSSLMAQGSAATELQNAIADKAPAETKTIAQTLGGKIGGAISNTSAKFKEICAGAPAAGASSSGSSSSGSSSSGSKAPPPADEHPAGHSGTMTTAKPAMAKPAASTTVPKPAQFTGAASQLSAGGLLALGAAILAL